MTDITKIVKKNGKGRDWTGAVAGIQKAVRDGMCFQLIPVADVQRIKPGVPIPDVYTSVDPDGKRWYIGAVSDDPPASYVSKILANEANVLYATYKDRRMNAFLITTWTVDARKMVIHVLCSGFLVGILGIPRRFFAGSNRIPVGKVKSSVPAGALSYVQGSTAVLSHTCVVSDQILSQLC